MSAEISRTFIEIKPTDLLSTIVDRLEEAKRNPELRPLFIKEVNEFFSLYMEMDSEAKKPYFGNGIEPIIGNIQQKLVDEDSELNWFPAEFLTDEDREVLGLETSAPTYSWGDPVTNEILDYKRKTIEAGAIKWEELSPAQRIQLVTTIKYFIDLCKAKHLLAKSGDPYLEIEKFSYSTHFIFNEPFDLKFADHKITVPLKWDALKHLVDLLLSESLESEMIRARRLGIVDFSKLLHRLKEIKEPDDTVWENQRQYIQDMIKEFIPEKKVFKGGYFFESPEFSTSESSPCADDRDRSSEDEQSNVENEKILADELRIYIATCNALGKKEALAEIKGWFQDNDFLTRYFPEDYLEVGEKAKVVGKILKQLKTGLEKFHSGEFNDQPQKEWNFLKGLWMVANDQLKKSGHFSYVEIIPSFEELSGAYCYWPQSIKVKVTLQNGKECPDIDLTPQEARSSRNKYNMIEKLASKVIDENLANYLQRKANEGISQASPSSRAGSRLASWFSGSRPSSAAGQASQSGNGSAVSPPPSSAVSPANPQLQTLETQLGNNQQAAVPGAPAPGSEGADPPQFPFVS